MGINHLTEVYMYLRFVFAFPPPPHATPVCRCSVYRVFSFTNKKTS